MRDAILVFNTGSSSIRFSLFSANVDPELICHGMLAVANAQTRFVVHDARGIVMHEEYMLQQGKFDHAAALRHLWRWQQSHASTYVLKAVGHRVVHGGMAFNCPTVITQDVVAQLRALIPLAPLHQPHSLNAMMIVAEEQPFLPQVACFDTAFHVTQPAVAQMFGLPREYFAEGIRRYGFHGLSYEYIASALPTVAPALVGKRVIIAHLGNGASLCALREGKSIATTMGMTALDGLLMGTRCGNLDPGVVLYLLAERHLDVTQLTDLLYHRCGLLGISGTSYDMRQLLADKSFAAREAIELFIYQVNAHMGTMAAALEGVDGIIFTGGIGEHAIEIRARICRAAAWLGLELDALANQRGGPCISTAESVVQAWVIATDEEKMIARHTWKAIG